MTTLLKPKKKAPKKNVKQNFSMHFRALQKDLKEVIASPSSAQSPDALWVAKEFHKLAPALEKLGLGLKPIPATNLGSAKKFDPYQEGVRVVQQLKVAEGGAYTNSEMREFLGLEPATLHKRRKDFGIVYWRDAHNNFHYPRWQFTEAGAVLIGIPLVLRAFKSSDEWRIMRYFLTPRKQLNDRTPLHLLREGQVEKVVSHAQFHASENTW